MALHRLFLVHCNTFEQSLSCFCRFRRVPLCFALELSNYSNVIFVNSAFISGSIYILHIGVPLRSIIASCVVGTSVTLSMEIVFLTPLSSIVMVFHGAHITLNRPRVSAHGSARVAIGMPAELVISPGGLSTEMCFPPYNCGVHWTILSKLRW